MRVSEKKMCDTVGMERNRNWVAQPDTLARWQRWLRVARWQRAQRGIAYAQRTFGLTLPLCKVSAGE